MLVGDGAVWVAVFLFGLAALNWPLLEVFRASAFWYLLLVWLVLVVLIARGARGGGAPPPQE